MVAPVSIKDLAASRSPRLAAHINAVVPNYKYKIFTHINYLLN